MFAGSCTLSYQTLVMVGAQKTSLGLKVASTGFEIGLGATTVTPCLQPLPGLLGLQSCSLHQHPIHVFPYPCVPAMASGILQVLTDPETGGGLLRPLDTRLLLKQPCAEPKSLSHSGGKAVTILIQN